MIAARLLIAEGGDRASTVRLAHEALIAGRLPRGRSAGVGPPRPRDARADRGPVQPLAQRRALGEPAAAQSGLGQCGRSRSPLGPTSLPPPLRDYIRQSARRARLGQTLVAAAAAVFFLVAVAAVFEGLLARSKEREAMGRTTSWRSIRPPAASRPSTPASSKAPSTAD